MSQLEKTLAHYAVMRSLERSPQTFKQLLESCHSLFPDQPTRIVASRNGKEPFRSA